MYRISKTVLKTVKTRNKRHFATPRIFLIDSEEITHLWLLLETSVVTLFKELLKLIFLNKFSPEFYSYSHTECLRNSAEKRKISSNQDKLSIWLICVLSFQAKVSTGPE